MDDHCYLTLDRYPIIISTHTERALLELEHIFAEATALYTAGELESSLALWQRARALGRKLGDAGREVKALSNIGALLYSLGNLDEAESIQKEALSRKEMFGDITGQAVTLGNLGVIYQERSSWGAALECFMQARSLAQSASDVAGEALHTSQMAAVHRLQGNCDQATT